MKTNLLAMAFVTAVALMGGSNLLNAQNAMDLSDIELANVEALGHDVNDMCPNGCLSDGKGCYCYGWHEKLKEAGPVIGEEEEGD